MLWSVESFVFPYFRFLGSYEFVGQLYTSKMRKVSTSALNISVLRKIGFKKKQGQLYTSGRMIGTVIHI